MKRCHYCRKRYFVFRGKFGFCQQCLLKLNQIKPD